MLVSRPYLMTDGDALSCLVTPHIGRNVGIFTRP